MKVRKKDRESSHLNKKTLLKNIIDYIDAVFYRKYLLLYHKFGNMVIFKSLWFFWWFSYRFNYRCNYRWLKEKIINCYDLYVSAVFTL